MNHNQQLSIKPTNASLNRFGVEHDNHFVVLDDGKHVIGIDARDARYLIIENIENGKADKFRSNSSFYNYSKTLLYDKHLGFFYTGVRYGQLYKYKLDKTSKTCKKVENYGDLEIGEIISCHRFLHFVFFGGSTSKIRVMDLSRNKLLPGHLQTSIGWICSFQVCVKSPKEIYLAVSGSITYYSKNKIDLFDVTGLFQNDSVILQKYL